MSDLRGERGAPAAHLLLGSDGERHAARFLEARGWKILARNVHIGRGELDIIARDGDELVIVEVRTRRIGTMAPPETTVGPRKLRKLIGTARRYVEKVGYDGNWRIDIVAVTEKADGSREIELFGDATMGMESAYLG